MTEIEVINSMSCDLFLSYPPLAAPNPTSAYLARYISSTSPLYLSLL